MLIKKLLLLLRNLFHQGNKKIYKPYPHLLSVPSVRE